MQIFWCRTFGPFTIKQAAKMMSVLKRKHARGIRLIYVDGVKHSVEARVPAQRAPDMELVAKALQAE